MACIQALKENMDLYALNALIVFVDNATMKCASKEKNKIVLMDKSSTAILRDAKHVLKSLGLVQHFVMILGLHSVKHLSS